LFKETCIIILTTVTDKRRDSGYGRFASVLKTNKATQKAAAQFILQPQYTDTWVITNALQSCSN